jgi:beta-glucosidase-like glycosyl hydrolase
VLAGIGRDLGSVQGDVAQLQALHLAEVQLVDDLDNKVRQVILRRPLIDRRSQQVGGVSISGNEAAHALGAAIGLARLSELALARYRWESPTGS